MSIKHLFTSSRAVAAVLAGTALAISTAATGATAATAHTAAAAGTVRPSDSTGSPIYFGVDGTVSQAAAGQNVARHIYGDLSGSVPVARMVTMQIDGYTYTDISSAQPGSAVYTNIVRWADTIAARGTLTFFGFVHEPEAHDQAYLGTAAQYVAAYQHVVDIMRAQNVTNIRYVWQMTAYSFAAKTTKPQYAGNYYPGDGYVDDVASDDYNWAGCSNTNTWRDLSSIAAPTLTFAAAHDKPVVIAEFASQAGTQRAQWLTNAGQWLAANKNVIQAAFYFDRPPTTTAGAACNWTLTSTADITAFRAIAADTTDFTA